MDNEKVTTVKAKTKGEKFGETLLKILACVLSVVLVFSVVRMSYSGANKYQTGNTASASVNSGSGQGGSNGNGNSFDNSNNTANAPDSNQGKNEAVVTGDMSNIADIVKLYNDSVNKVKTDATGLTRTYKHMQSLPEYLELPSSIQSIGSAAMEQFVKGTDEPQTWSSKEEIKIIFPVGGEDYSSHLTADMVQSADCKDNGSTYTISIKLLDDKITSPKKGEGYAGVFNTVTASTFSDINIPTVTFETVNVNGINGSINCTIDKASGRVTEITFANTDVLHLGVKVAFSNMNVQFALAVEENYTIAY